MIDLGAKGYLTIASILVGLFSFLGLYLKGRSDGKTKGELVMKDAEIEAWKNLREKEDKAKKNRNERRRLYEKTHEGIDDIYRSRDKRFVSEED